MRSSIVNSSRSLPFLLTCALVRNDIPDATEDEVVAAAAKVVDSIESMPDVTRYGVRVTATVLNAALTTYCRAPFGCLPAERQQVVANRLAGNSLPILSEFVRLTRGLGIVSVYESRTSPLSARRTEMLHG
jgi:hypothetical protein